MAYGYPADKGDPLQLVKIAEDAMHGFAVASEPGRWWVDSFPLREFSLTVIFDYSSFLTVG